MKKYEKILFLIMLVSLIVIVFQTGKAVIYKGQEEKLVSYLQTTYKDLKKTCTKENSKTIEIKNYKGLNNNKLIRNGKIDINDDCNIQFIAENGRISIGKYYNSDNLYKLNEVYSNSQFEMGAGQYIYFDVDTGRRCYEYFYQENIKKTKGLLSNGCMKFYIYDHDDNNQLAILDHNITTDTSYDLDLFKRKISKWQVFDNVRLLTKEEFSKFNDPIKSYWIYSNTINNRGASYISDEQLPYGFYLEDTKDEDLVYGINNEGSLVTVNKWDNTNMGFRPVIKMPNGILNKE